MTAFGARNDQPTLCFWFDVSDEDRTVFLWQINFA